MSQPILSLGVWASLPNEVRYRIRALFNIPKTGVTEVNDGILVSDGTTHTDLSNLTIEKMQSYVGESVLDFYKLFDLMVAKVNDELYPPKATVEPSDTITVIVEPKKKGRPAKNVKTK